MSQTWKKSGGIKQFDAMNNITVNSITTDEFAMRTPYKGTFTISGELYVFDDASFNKNVKISSNEYVEKNIYLRQKLVMGKEWERTDGAREDSYRNFFISDQSGVGLNIENPNAVLDICGTSQNILHVYSSADKTSNILARNKNHHRIALEVDNSNTQIVFTHHHSDVEDVSSAIVFEPTTEQIRFPKQVAITSVLKPSTASLVVASNSLNEKPFLNSIYDVSSKSVPLHVHSLDVSGIAMAFFSNNQDKGWYFGGGNYPKDPTRQMGLMGWQDPSGTFLPSQIQVTTGNNNLIKNRITTGINTYMPLTEDYVLDINGPLKIHHQEIREALRSNFTIHSVSFSKKNPLFGLAVGKENVIRDNISYNTIHRTTDSGITWDSTDISFGIGSSGQAQETTLGVFAFDMSNAVIVSKGAEVLHIFRTNTQGVQWSKDVSPDFFDNKPTASTLKPYAIDFSNILLGETDISCNEIKFFSYSSSSPTNVIGTMNPNRQITSMDGYMDLYGNATILTADTSGCIYKYTYTQSNDTFTYGPNQHYNLGSPYLFITSSEVNDYVLACGNNIISVKTFYDVSFTDISFDNQSLVFNHAVVRDLSHAIVVGNDGVIYYARNDIREKSNWNRVTEDMVRGMGNAELIIHNTRQLTHVHSTDNSCNFIFTYGSRLVHAYLPDLWFPEDSPPLISIDGHIETTRQSIHVFENHVETIHIGRYAKDTLIDMCGNVHVNNSFHHNIHSNHVHIQKGGAGIFLDDISSSEPFLYKNDVPPPNLNTALYDISNTVSLNGTIWIKGNLVVDGSTNIINDNFDVKTGQSIVLKGTLQPTMHVSFLDFSNCDNDFKGSGFYISNNRTTDADSGTAHFCVSHEGFMKVSNEHIDKLSFRSIGHHNVVALDFSNIQTYTPQFNSLLVLNQHNIPNVLSDVSDNFYIRSSHCDNTTIDVSARMLNIFDLSVNKNVDIFGKEFVAGDVSFNSQLAVGKHVQFYHTLDVEDDVSFHDNVYVDGDIVIGNRDNQGLGYKSSRITFNSGVTDSGDFARLEYFDDSRDISFLRYGSDFFDRSSSLLDVSSSCLLIHTMKSGDGSNNDNMIIRAAANMVLDTGAYIIGDVPTASNRPTNAGDILILPNGGNLGVGKINPNAVLDVSGDVSFNSQLAVGKHVQFYHTLDVEDDVSFHDNVYVDGDIVIGNRDNQGLGYKSSRITFNSGVTDSGDFARLEYFDDSRDISFLRYGSDFFDRSSSLLDVSSSCLLIHTMKSGDGSNNDNMIIRAAANMVLDTGAYIIGDVPTASNRPTNAGDILILPNGGNLGVGKINPNAVLDVSGDVSFNSQLAVGKHVQFYHTLDVEDDVSFHDNVYVDGDIVIGNRDNQGLGYKSSRITFNSGVTDSGDFARLEYFDDISGSSDVLKSLRYGGNFYDSTSAKSSCLLISTANNGHGNDNMIIRPAAHLVIDTGVYTGGTSITSSGGGGQIMIFPNGGSNKKVSIGKPSDDDESYSMQPGLQPILDVSGDVHFENSLYVQGDFIIKGALKSQAQLEVTGDVTFINMTVSGETTLNGLTTSNNSILLCKKTDDADSKIEFQSKINSTDKATIQYFDSTTKKPFLQYGPDFSGSANNSCLAISSYVDGQNISGGDNILIRPASKLVLDTGYYSSSSVEAPSRTNRSSGGDILILPNGGRLGIGRNDPKTNLDVSGDISFNGKLYVRDNIGLGMQPTVDHKLSVAGGDVSFSNSLFVGGNATIQGNFTIQGTTTTINSTVQTIKDPVIILGEGSADLSSGWRDDYFDRGLMFKLTDTSYGFMGYDRSMSAFRFVNNITTEVSSNRVQSSDYSKEGTLFAKSYTCNDNSGIAQIVLYGSNTDGTAYSTWNGITTRKTAQVYNVANSTLNHVFMYGCENITNTNDISGGVIVTEIASTGMSIYGNVFVKNDVSFNSKLYVGSDVSFNSKLFVKGDVSFNAKLYVNSDVSFAKGLTVNSDASFGGVLTVSNKSNFYNDVSLSKYLFVGSDVSFNSKLFVKGDVSFNAKLYVNSDVSFAKGLTVNSDASFGGVLTVSNKSIFYNDVSLSKSLFVGSDVSFNSKLFVKEDVSFNAKLYVNSDVSFAKGLTVNSDASFGGVLTVSNKSNFYNDVSLSKYLFVGSDVSFNSKLFVNGDVSFGSGLAVTGRSTFNNDISLNRYLFVGNDVSLNTRLYVGGDVSFNQKLKVSGDVSFGSGLTVTGRSTFNNDISLSRYLFVGNDVSLNTRLYVGGDVSFNQKLKVSGDVSFGSGLTVTGRSTFNNDISLSRYLFVGNDVSLNTRLYVGGDVSLNAKLKVSGDVSFNGGLTVMGPSSFVNDVTLNANLTVGDGVDIAGNLNVGGSVNIDGSGGGVNISGLIRGGLAVNRLDYSSNFMTWSHWQAGGIYYHTGSSGVNSVITSYINNSTFYLYKEFAGVFASSMIFGYFSPLLSGSYTFYMNANDQGIFWLGSNARNGVFTYSNSLLESHEEETTQASVVLQAGKKYPVRFLYVNNAGAGVLIFKYTTPSNGTFDDVDFSQFYYSPFPGYDPSPDEFILDIDGGQRVDDLYVSGNLMVTDGGDLTVMDGDVSFNGNLTVSGRSTFNNDISLSNYLFVGNDVSLNTRLYVGGDVSFNQKLKVSGDVSFNGGLTVTGRSTFNNDISLSNYLFVGNDVSLNTRLYVGGDVSFNQKLKVSGDVSFGSGLTVTGRSTFINDISLSNYLFVGNDVSLNTRLYVGGDVSFNQKLKVSGDVSFGSGLTVTGRSTFNNDISLSRYLFVGNDVSLNTRLYVGGDVSFNQKLKVSGDVSFGSGLTVTGRSTFNNDISLNRYLFVGNDVSLNKRLYVGSDVSLNAKLYVNGDVSFGAGVDIAGNFRVAGGGTVNLDSSGGVHVSGLISGGLALNKLVYNSTIMNKANWLSNLIYYHTGSDGINSVSTGYTSSNSIVDIFNLHSIMIFGYFSVSSDVTYNIHISIYSTRLLFWFGSNARTGYYTYANSRIKLDRTENLNTSGYTTISMKAGKKYPIRILKSSETLNDTSIGFKYSSNTSNNDGPWQNFDFSNFYYSPFPGYSPSPDVSVLKIDGGQRVDDLYVSGNLMLTDGGDLTVIGGGDVSFGGGLTVTGRSTFNNDISLSNYLFVGNDVSLNTRLYVGGNVSLNTKLYVNGDVSFGSGLTVTNRSTFNNDISLSRYLFVGNDVSLNTRLYVGGDVSFNQKLKVSGDVSFNAGLTVKGVSDFSGVTIKSVLKLEGGPVTDDVNVESSNKTNTYIRFGAAGSADDWVYLRQIGTSDNIQLALDFHDNSGDAGFVIRDISSAGNGADSSFNERFKVKRGGGVVINGTLDVNGGAVTVIGDVTATSFNATSDYRMKENVEKLSFAECSVENLNPVSYILKTNKQPHIGFLAHELQEYFPTAVSGVKDGEAMQTVNYLELIPVLVKEIQELKKKVLFLENDIDYLKQELSGF